MFTIKESQKKAIKMSFNKVSGLVFLLVCLLFSVAVSQTGIIVNLKIAENPWADSHLKEKLDLMLSTISQVLIIRADASEHPDAGPLQTSHLNALIEHGQTHNGRFLIDVFIDRIDIEKRKAFILPGLIFRYQVYGTAVGKIRIIDIKKARLVDMIDLDCSLKAKDRWQFVDDDPFDADLKVSADKKIILFDRLEEKVAGEIFKEVKKLSKGNHFGD